MHYTYLPQILIFFGLLLTFLGGFISFKRDEITQKENKALVNENKRLLESNLGLSESIKNHLTGGDSFGVVKPTSIVENGKHVYFLCFENKGTFPMYNVEVSFWNPDEMKKKQASNDLATTEMFKLNKGFYLDTVPSNIAKPFGSIFNINEGELMKLNFFISSKNGSFAQILRMTKRHGKLCVANKVNTIGENSKVIFEEISPLYPRNSKGQIDWD